MATPNPSGLLGRIPKRRTLPRVLTGEEVHRLVDVASEPDDEVKHFTGCKVLKNHRDKALVLTALDTGLRLGEIAGLQVADLQDGWLQVDGKTGERQVPVSPEVLDLIWLQVVGDDVWPSTKGGRLTRRGVQLVLSRLIEDAGIQRTRPGQRIGPHCLRHTFATWYIRRGGKVAVLKEILGHDKIETTMLYVTLAGVDVAADHAQYSPVGQLGLIRDRQPEA